MEMIDVLKSRLPYGLKVVEVKPKGDSQSRILFSFFDQQLWGSIPNKCSSEVAASVCNQTICTAMMGFALQGGDLVAAKIWSDLLQEEFA